MVLHERFTDSSRAASYVAAGIRSDFPGSKVEVVLEKRGHQTRHECNLRDLGRVLAQCCMRFPMASVYYDRDEPTGQVGEIHCHCRQEQAFSCCRHNHHPRHRVLVILLPAEAKSEEAAKVQEPASPS